MPHFRASSKQGFVLVISTLLRVLKGVWNENAFVSECLVQSAERIQTMIRLRRLDDALADKRVLVISF